MDITGDDPNNGLQKPEEENLYKTVVKLAAPSWVELLLSQLTSMVDLMMVGNIGAWAIAAVGLSTQPKFLLMAVFIALNSGTTALVSRFRGKGELADGAGSRDDACRTARQAIMLNLTSGVVFGIVGYIVAPSLIRFMGGTADEQTVLGGIEYLRIQMYGLPAIAVTSAITAALRGGGNTRSAMVYNLTANGVNIVLNFLLIEGNLGAPRLEVAGASIATVVSQYVACFMAFGVLARGKNFVKLTRGDSWVPDKDTIKRMTRIGFPAMIEQLLMRGGMMAFSKIVAELGTVALATHQACMSVLALSFVNGDAFGIAAAALMGRSLGKNRPDLALEYTRRARRIGMAVSLAIGIIFFFCGKYIIGLYNDDAEIIAMGIVIFRLMAVIMPFQGSSIIVSGALRGAGDTRATSVIVFISVLIVRPLVAAFFVFGVKWGLAGAWLAIMTDQILRAFLTIIRLNRGQWKKINV